MILAFKYLIALIATFGMFVYGCVLGTNNSDLLSKYNDAVESVTIYQNDFDSAIPQTDLYGYISEHFSSELPEGKTEKKAIVIGYDGCRADALSLINDSHVSAIRDIMDEGGNAVLAYCGGKNYPTINSQDTSTAPGWCSILTGKWANETGITENSVPKSNEYLTLLTTLVEDNTIDASAFYVSWDGHFVDSDSTYINEKLYCEEKGLDVKYIDAGDDDGTKANTLADIQSADCSDFIFTIFEYTDHVGHDTGFSIYNEEYVNIFYEAEQTAADVINAIKARDTYETEDWLIIITSDHGGYNTAHGGPTKQERYTFVVSNKEITINESSSGIFDIVC